MRFNFFIVSIILIVIFHLSSCSKSSDSSNVEFYTHAVTGLSNPNSYFTDNTPEGLEYALSFDGLDGIELDVQISADSTLWMFHDYDLSERTSGEGSICNKTDEYLSGVTINKGKLPLTKLKHVDLNNVSGSKEVFIDVKYIGACGNVPISAEQLVHQCAPFLSHPALQVSFIINNVALAGEVNNMGYSVWKDGTSLQQINLSSTIYQGWFVRNTDLNQNEVSTIKAANKSVILYDTFASGTIKKAIQKKPTAVLVEDVKEAVLLGQ